MHIGSTLILDTFAEAFRMRYARLVVTAADDHWLDCALREFCGYGASVIGCDAEVGIERRIPSAESPDGRRAAAVLAFGFSVESLAAAVVNRTGQCLLTCPTTAAFNGLADADEFTPLGKQLRFFGDGFQKSKVFGDRRYWRIPVMDGEFVVEDRIGVAKGIAGGNLILQGAEQTAVLAASRRAVDAIAEMPGVITPFPGGVVRSGSKVGSKYRALRASTNEAYCPTLRGRAPSLLVDGAQTAYEIVINGVDEPAIANAMKAAMDAAASDGVLAIGAGNYGGRLGKFHFHLRSLVSA